MREDAQSASYGLYHIRGRKSKQIFTQFSKFNHPDEGAAGNFDGRKTRKS